MSPGLGESINVPLSSALRHKTAAMTARYVKQRDRGVNAAAMAGILFGPPESPAETPAGHGLKLAKGT